MRGVKSNYGKESLCGGQLVLDLYPEKLLRAEHLGSSRRQGSTTVGGQQLPPGRKWRQIRRGVSRLSKAAVAQLHFDPYKERLVVDVLMAKAKSCKNSKGCGSSCVSLNYLCRLEISEKDQKALDAFTDKLINRGSDLKTPEEAAKWMEDHAESLARDTKDMRNYGNPKADMLMISTEFGGDPSMTHYDDKGNLQSRFARVVKPEDSQVSLPMSKEQIADWYTRNPVAWANAHKQNYEADIALNKDSGGILPKVNPGVLLGTKSGKTVPAATRVETVEGWANLKQRYFQRTAKLAGSVEGIKSIATLNLSPLQVNTADNWPPSKLPLSKGSPLATRNKWLQYSSEKLAQETVKHIKDNPTKVVYVSGNTKAHDKFYTTLQKGLGGSDSVANTRTKTSGSGKESVVKARSFTYVDPRTGAKHVVVQGTHPSAQSFSNEELAIIAAIMSAGLG